MIEYNPVLEYRLNNNRNWTITVLDIPDRRRYAYSERLG